tara:strand:- start:1787 stop:2341 length:555 start_codon:yes stop_codon:yes gene_type:complete
MKKNNFFALCLLISFMLMGFSINYTFAETNTVSSTVVTNSTPPTANAPSIINSNSDICKVGVGASVQNNIVGLASGIVIDDELCQKLKLSRSLYAYGMKVAAVSVLCQDPRVFDAMMDSQTPCPTRGGIGADAQTYWANNPSEIPDGSKYKPEYIKAQTEEKPTGDNDALKNFGLMALSMLLLL